MPRRKQTTPKKHGEENVGVLSSNDVEALDLSEQKRDTNDPSDEVQETSNVETSEDEILDLSIKKRKRVEEPPVTTTSSNCSKSPLKSTAFVDYKVQPTPTSFPLSFPNYSIVPPFFPYSISPQHHVINFPTKSSNTSTVLPPGHQTDNTLSKLNSLVSKVGKEILQKHPASVMNEAATKTPASVNGLNFQELWWRFVKKEENAEVKRINEAKQIFTCLQCQASFQTMDLLVKHMETTRHYANIPKHYSWSLQYARQKMRQMKMKMKYSEKMMYFCFLCQTPFTEPVHIHFNCVHNMHNPVENMKHVHIISMGVNHQSPSSSTSSSLKKKWSRSSSTSTNGSEGSSPSNGGTDNLDGTKIPSSNSVKSAPSPKISEDKIASKDLFLKMEEIVANATAAKDRKGQKK